MFLLTPINHTETKSRRAEFWQGHRMLTTKQSELRYRVDVTWRRPTSQRSSEVKWKCFFYTETLAALNTRPCTVCARWLKKAGSRTLRGGPGEAQRQDKQDVSRHRHRLVQCDQRCAALHCLLTATQWGRLKASWDKTTGPSRPPPPPPPPPLSAEVWAVCHSKVLTEWHLHHQALPVCTLSNRRSMTTVQEAPSHSLSLFTFLNQNWIRF